MRDLPDSKAPGAAPEATVETTAAPAATAAGAGPALPDDDAPGTPAGEAIDIPEGAPADDEVAPGAVTGTAPPRAEVQPVAARPAPSHLRCFLAINFPMVTVRRIADEIAALRGPVAAAGLSVRWVPAPNLHLTLKFLGPVRAAAVEAVAARLAAGLGGVRPFELEARGVGAFPSVERPRVLWVGVSAQPALVALQQAVEGWMAEIGFPRDERAYHPHITIGRVTGQGSHDGGGGGDRPGDLGALLSERGARAFGTGRATEVVIYESRTLSKGAEYHALGRVPLSA